MTEEADWMEKALRSQAIAQKIVGLLNDLDRIAPDVYAEILGPGFCIRGHGNFRVDSLLTANDLNRAADLIGPGEDCNN